jgi:hypothetical protein
VGDSCRKEIEEEGFRKCHALTWFFILKNVELVHPFAFEKSGVGSIIVDEANQFLAFDQGLLLNHPGRI